MLMEFKLESQRIKEVLLPIFMNVLDLVKSNPHFIQLLIA